LNQCAKVQWILSAVMAAAVGIFLLCIYLPQTRKLKELDMSIATKQRELGASQSRANTLPTVKVDLDKLRLSVENYDKKLPRQPALGEFLKNVTQLSSQASLRNLSVQPGLPRRLDLFSELPISMHFEGDAMNVFSFLRQTEQMPRITRVRSVDIHTLDPKLGTVEVQLAINLYFTDG
jgi:Tfp pilus assembly protein PilO